MVKDYQEIKQVVMQYIDSCTTGYIEKERTDLCALFYHNQ